MPGVRVGWPYEAFQEASPSDCVAVLWSASLFPFPCTKGKLEKSSSGHCRYWWESNCWVEGADENMFAELSPWCVSQWNTCHLVACPLVFWDTCKQILQLVEHRFEALTIHENEKVSWTSTDCWITVVRESTASPSCKRPEAGLFLESWDRNSKYGSGQVHAPDCEQRRWISAVKPSLLMLLHRAFILLWLNGFCCLTFFLSLGSSSRDRADLSRQHVYCQEE